MDDPSRNFSDDVDEALGEFLAGFGFSRLNTSSSRVTYERDGVLISFAYFVEDLPSPWVAIDVGLSQPDDSQHLVGLWRALADEEPARRYPSWRFVDRASLDEVLQRIAREVLAVHGPRLWGSATALEALVAEQANEAETTFLRNRRQADLLRARRAHDEGRFQEAIDSFVLMDPDTLSATDRRRLYEARKQVGDVSRSEM